MFDDIEATGSDSASRLGRADVCPHEAGALGNVSLMTPGEIVQNHNVPASGEIRFRDMGSNEACPTRDQYPASHASRLRISISPQVRGACRQLNAPQSRNIELGSRRGSGWGGRKRKGPKPGGFDP